MERKHYLDHLRAFLMFLGIPYHTAMIYSTNIDWLVSSVETSFLLTWVFEFTHTFRMPAFMIVSGFFAVMMIRKQGEGVWLRSRLLRLGVPLVSVALLVNPWQMLARALAASDMPGARQIWLSMLSSPGGHWVEQLWFLADLLIYSTVLALGWRYGGKLRLEPVCNTVLDLIGRDWKSVALALTLVGAGAVAAATAGSMLDLNILLSGMIQAIRTITFAPFFLLGAALAYRPEWLERFTTLYWPACVAAGVACVSLTLVEPMAQPAYKAASYFLTPIAGILSAHVLLSVSRRWFNHANAVGRRMADASMDVYLFHMVFVCWFGLLFTRISWPVMGEFAVIVIGTMIASFSVHSMVRRSETLRFLFNGISPRVHSGGRRYIRGFQSGP